MGACFNVTIECQANYMVANVAANRMFDGKVGLPKSSNDDSPNLSYGYRVSHLVKELDLVDLDLDVLSCCLAAKLVLLDSHLPKQN